MCVAGRPSAGGNAPLWQVEHWLVTVTCVWLNLVGFQPVTAWQLKQFTDALTGTWVLGLPVAELPWQLAQLVAEVNPLWSTLAPAHPLVVWQVSQPAVVCRWVADLPAAGGKPPVWQVAHCPVTVTLLWNLAGAQAAKPPLWHVSQFALETPDTFWYGMWFAVRPSAGGNAPLWHVEHWLVTVACVWLNLVGFQVPVGLWQLKQFAVVGMCADGLPVAVRPWQVVQSVAAVKVLWSAVAPAHPLVDLWQVSHAAVVWIWLADFPAAGGYEPVWQVAHCPVTDTLLWNLADAQAVNPPLWHVSQLAFEAPDTFW
jgi:hypothetical protein